MTRVLVAIAPASPLLRGAPKYSRTSDWDWNDRARDRQVYDYYQAPLYIDACQ